MKYKIEKKLQVSCTLDMINVMKDLGSEIFPSYFRPQHFFLITHHIAFYCVSHENKIAYYTQE